MSLATTLVRVASAAVLLAPMLVTGCKRDDGACEGEDAFEPNSTIGTATQLTIETGAPWSEPSLALCAADNDWFSFEAKGGQVVDANLAFTHADGDLQLELLDAEGAVLDESLSLTDDEWVRYTALEDGAFNLRIFGASGRTANAYGLTVALDGEPCARDAQEPNDTAPQATTLASGAWTDLTVCFGEADWYEIAAADGQVVEIDADFSGGAVELALYRRDADGTLAWLAEAGPTSTGAELVHRISGVGPFLLQVVRGASTTNATYDLSLQITGDACIADPFEANDGYYDATPVASGDAFTDLSLCVGDRDWYEVEVANGELLDVGIAFTHADSDLALQLYKLNPDGTLTFRAGSDTVTDDERIRYRPYDSGTYVFQVYPSRGSVLGTYDLSVDVTGEACTEDGHEPNNNASEASPLAPGAYADTTLCVGDDDWYEFELGNGQIATAKIGFTHAENDLGLQLYQRDPDGTVTLRSSSNTLTNQETLTYQPFQGGTYLLRVYRSRGEVVASYTLDLAVAGETCAPDTFEPNDGYPQATPATVGSTEKNTLCVGDADWYSVEIQNGQLIEVELDFVHADSDLGMTLYRLAADGTIAGRVSADTFSDGETLTYRPYDSGTFLIYVYRSRGTSLAEYDMTVRVTGDVCTPDTLEPNDAPAEAKSIVAGRYDDQTLCVGDSDYLLVELDNGELLDVTIAFEHAKNDLALTVYKLNDDGSVTTRASANSLTDDEHVTYRPFDSGKFIIFVGRSRGTQVATYDLDVKISGSACAPDAFEPNDAYTQAQVVTPGDDFGALSLCVGDQDWYQISASNGQLVDVQLSFTHAANDLGVRLYKIENDGTITSRATSDSLTDNEWILYRPYDQGDFLVNVYRSRGTTVADYTLSIDVTGAECEPDAFEPNDHWLQAVALPLGTLHDDLTSCVGDDDWYDLGKLDELTVIRAAAFFTHADNDLALNLYAVNADNTVTSVVSSDTVSDDEFAVYAVPQEHAGKPFRARVTRSRGTPLGSYALQVEVE